MTGSLRTEAEILAAGAEAVAGWELTDRTVDQVVAILAPVAADIQAGGDADSADTKTVAA